MTQEIKLRIGGIGISIRWQGASVFGWPHPYYEGFVWKGPTEVNLKLDCHLPLPYAEDQLLFDGEREGYWRLYRKNSGYAIETYDPLTRKKNKVCFLDRNFRYGHVFVDSQADRLHAPKTMCSDNPAWSLPILMQHLGQLLLVNILADEGGIMAHGLGVDDEGTGVAFLGPSGTGKSTLARFYLDQEGVNVLSDEHIIIRKEGGEFFLYGTPWPGLAATVSAKRVRLERVFVIRHFPTHSVLGEALAGDLFPLFFLPFWDGRRLKSTVGFCEDLLKNLKPKKLGFAKERSIVGFVKAEGKEGATNEAALHDA